MGVLTNGLRLLHTTPSFFYRLHKLDMRPHNTKLITNALIEIIKYGLIGFLILTQQHLMPELDSYEVETRLTEIADREVFDSAAVFAVF